MAKKESLSNLWYALAILLPILINGIISLAIMSIIYLAYLKKKDKEKANSIAKVYLIVFALTIIVPIIFILLI